MNIILRFCLLAILFTSTESAYAQIKKNGKSTTTDSEGNISKGKCKKYLKEGIWKTYYASGTMKNEGNFSKGFQEGKHVEYNPEGTIHSITYYKNGRRNGAYILFDDRGDTLEHSNYTSGRLHGYFFGYSPESKTSQLGNYDNGFKEGWWVYKSVSQTDSVFLTLGQKQNLEIINKSNGLRTVARYTSGARNGIYYEYLNGKVSRKTMYYYGKVVEYDIEYFTNTDSIYRAKYYSMPDVIDYAIWYRSPGIVERKFIYNQEAGNDTVFYYDDSGRLERLKIAFPKEQEYGYRCQKTEIFYTNGQHQLILYNRQGRDSTWTYYNENGTLNKIVSYKNDRPYGSYLYYYPSGILQLSAWIRHTEQADSIKMYTSTGKRIKSGTPAYNKILRTIDSLETEIVFIPPPPDEYVWQAPPPPAVKLTPSDPQEVYTFPEETPQFPGGNDSLQNFLQKHLRYPILEKEQGKSGTVYVGFDVERDGSLSNIQMVKEIPNAPGFSKEAMRVIALMPKWIPGKMNGRSVKVGMTIPINFNLH